MKSECALSVFFLQSPDKSSVTFSSFQSVSWKLFWRIACFPEKPFLLLFFLQLWHSSECIFFFFCSLVFLYLRTDSISWPGWWLSRQRGCKWKVKSLFNLAPINAWKPSFQPTAPPWNERLFAPTSDVFTIILYRYCGLAVSTLLPFTRLFFFCGDGYVYVVLDDILYVVALFLFVGLNALLTFFHSRCSF